MEQFILRKLIVVGILLGAHLLMDRVLLRGFNTAQLLRDHPQAVATLLAGFCVAVALA